MLIHWISVSMENARLQMFYKVLKDYLLCLLSPTFNYGTYLYGTRVLTGQIVNEKVRLRQKDKKSIA